MELQKKRKEKKIYKPRKSTASMQPLSAAPVLPAPVKSGKARPITPASGGKNPFAPGQVQRIAQAKRDRKKYQPQTAITKNMAAPFEDGLNPRDRRDQNRFDRLAKFLNESQSATYAT